MILIIISQFAKDFGRILSKSRTRPVIGRVFNTGPVQSGRSREVKLDGPKDSKWTVLKSKSGRFERKKT